MGSAGAAGGSPAQTVVVRPVRACSERGQFRACLGCVKRAPRLQSATSRQRNWPRHPVRRFVVETNRAAGPLFRAAAVLERQTCILGLTREKSRGLLKHASAHTALLHIARSRSRCRAKDCSSFEKVVYYPPPIRSTGLTLGHGSPSSSLHSVSLAATACCATAAASGWPVAARLRK